MSNPLYRQIYENFNQKETPELLDIWTKNDRVEWSDLTFEVLTEILVERLGELPAQNEPVVQREEEQEESQEEEETQNPEGPMFYRPKEVLWLNTWLKRGAVVAVIITILTSIGTIFSIQSTIASMFGYTTSSQVLAWLIAVLGGGLAVLLQCFIYFFGLRALASVLKILMTMEFNSRAK